jgi:hypothetical protein
MPVDQSALNEYFKSRGATSTGPVMVDPLQKPSVKQQDLSVPSKNFDKNLDNYFNNKKKNIKLQSPVKSVESGIGTDRKYTFDKDSPDSIYKDRNLIDTARAYYYERDGLQFQNDNEIVEYYISDRTWKQANSYSIGKELIYATSDSVSMDQKRRLKYLTEYWGAMPNFWEDGGRGYLSGIVSNLSRGLVDPANLIGPGVGKLILQQTVKTGGKYALTKAVASGTTAQVGIDAAIGSSADAMIQKTEKELGLRERFDPQRNFQVAAITGGASLIPGLPINYFATKSMLAKPTLIKNWDKTKQTVFDYANPLKNNVEKLYGVRGNIDDYVTQSKKIDKILKELSDKPDDVITKKLNQYFKQAPEDRGALKLSQKELSLLRKKDERINNILLRDPGDYAYTSFRMLAASSTRADSAIRYEVVLPVVTDRNKFGKTTGVIVKSGYERSNAIPLTKILDPLDDRKLLPVFNDYIQAVRSATFNKQGIKTTMSSADQKKAYQAYNKLNKSDKNLFANMFAEEQKYTQALLELQRRSGIISEKQMQKILKENPVYAPFYLRTKESAKQTAKKAEAAVKLPKVELDKRYPVELVGEAPEIVAGTKGPARLKITGSDKEIQPLHESLAQYTFHAYSAAEKNLAKLKMYDEIDDLITTGVFKKNEIVRRVTSVSKVNAIKKDVIRALKVEADESGIKFDSTKFTKSLEGEDSIKVAAFKDTIKTTDGSIIDVVYRNGKLEMYEILDPAYVDMVKSLGGITHKYLRNLIYGNFNKGGFLGKVGSISRVFPQLITHSPPFIAFNFIRDTLAGSINSAFGFNAYGLAPGLSTAKGLFGTFKAPKDMFDSVVKNASADGGFRKYYTGFKEALGLNQNYLKALNSGMGFASRRDSERLVKQLTLNLKNSKAKNKQPYIDSLNFLKEIGFYGTEAFKGYAQLVNRIEYASRLAEFNLAKRVGVSDVVAAFAGREISTDFGMHGASAGLNAYNRLTMFFNAGLQGFYRGVVRRVGENKVKFGTGVMATIVAPELLFWSLTNETPEYEGLDDDIKLLNYVIPIYEDTKVDGSHLRPDGTRRIKTFFLVPKPYDFGAFANIARGIMEAIQEGAPEIAVNYAYHSIAKVFPGLATPTLASPVVDLIRNRNYKNKEIQPYYQTVGQYRDQQIKTNTRFTSEKIAKGINDIYRELFSIKQQNPFEGIVSPITIDYILNNYFVGLAEYPLDIADAMVGWDDEAFGPRPKARIDESDIARNKFSIVTRRFFAKVPTKYNKNLSKLYDLKREAEKVKTTMTTASEDIYRLMRNKMNVDIIKDNTDKIRSSIAVSDMLSEGLIAIKNLREKRQIISISKISPAGIPYTAEQKRIDIDRLQTLENQLAYNLMRDLKESADPYVMMSLFGNKTFKSYRDKNIKLKGFQKTIQKYFD